MDQNQVKPTTTDLKIQYVNSTKEGTRWTGWFTGKKCVLTQNHLVNIVTVTKGQTIVNMLVRKAKLLSWKGKKLTKMSALVKLDSGNISLIIWSKNCNSFISWVKKIPKLTLP